MDASIEGDSEVREKEQEKGLCCKQAQTAA
jgi:hypothetical protein